MDATFDIPRPHPVTTVPATALICNHDGLQASVADDDRRHVRKLSVDRDLGKTVEPRDGLKGGEQVVDNPPANSKEGQRAATEQKPAEQAMEWYAAGSFTTGLYDRTTVLGPAAFDTTVRVLLGETCRLAEIEDERTAAQLMQTCRAQRIPEAGPRAFSTISGVNPRTVASGRSQPFRKDGGRLCAGRICVVGQCNT